MILHFFTIGRQNKVLSFLSHFSTIRRFIYIVVVVNLSVDYFHFINVFIYASFLNRRNTASRVMKLVRSLKQVFVVVVVFGVWEIRKHLS